MNIKKSIKLAAVLTTALSSFVTFSSISATSSEPELFIHPKLAYSPWELLYNIKLEKQTMTWLRKVYATHSAFKSYDSQDDAKIAFETYKNGVLLNTGDLGKLSLVAKKLAKQNDGTWLIEYTFDRGTFRDGHNNDIAKIRGNKFNGSVTLSKTNYRRFEAAAMRSGYVEVIANVDETPNSMIADFICTSSKRVLTCKASAI